MILIDFSATDLCDQVEGALDRARRREAILRSQTTAELFERKSKYERTERKFDQGPSLAPMSRWRWFWV